MVGIYCRFVVTALCLLMCSCGSSRKAERSDSSVSVHTSSSEKQSLKCSSTTNLTDFVKTDLGIRFNWVRYDTTKPPDKDGNYPKQAEGSGELDLHSSEGKHIETNDSLMAEASNDSSSQEESENHTVLEKEKEDTDIFSDITWMCIAIPVMVIVIFIVSKLRK